MSRQEADREDLIAEATALVERGEFAGPGFSEPITVGRRRSGGWSIYFGGDPCYHLDAEGRLRRAFAGGKLYRTQGQTLAELVRVRTADATELRRRDLSREELARFLSDFRSRLERLRSAIRDESLTCRRCMPPDCPMGELLSAALDELLASPLRLAPSIAARS
jgi:hypothetical protein